MARISLERLLTLDKNFLLRTDEVAAVVDLSPATVSKHRRAGLLPWVPSNPIRHRVGDVLVYRRMLMNGVSKQLHRTLVIDFNDRAIYSPLQTINNFTEDGIRVTIDAVIKETDMLWKKYKMRQEADRAAKSKRAAE